MRKIFSLKWKILLIFFVITTLIIATVLTVSIQMNTKNVMDLAQKRLEESTDEIKSIIELFFKEKAYQANAIAHNEYVKTFLTTGEGMDIVEKILESHYHNYNQFENCFIANKEGFIKAIAVNKNEGMELDIKVFPFWRLSEERDEYHVDEIVYRSPVTDRLVTVVATRIEDDDGNFLGLVGMPIFWEDFINLYILDKKIGTTGDVSVLDKNMMAIAHGNPEFLMKDFSGFDFIKTAYETKSGFFKFYMPAIKQWRFAAYDVIEKTGWKVAIAISVNEFVHEINKARNMILIIGLLLLFIGIFFIYFFIDKISATINMITEGANRFAVGDVKLEGMDWNKIEKINERNDELGLIGQAFARLIGYFQEKTSIATEIAQGNLTVDVPISSVQDQLGRSLHDMVISLNQLISKIHQSVEQVNSGAAQISNASQTLSQGASEQAASVEEISSSVTQISSQARQNSDNALTVNQVSKSSLENAEKGNEQIKQLIKAMNNINSSAKEINNIIKTIDDIAFQINLLALNANIEAARAGKFGRGFAVVAEEVRNLAVRSTDSVKETTNVVEAAATNINSGNQIVEQTAQQLEAIVGNAVKVVELVEEITSASKEQAAGLEQINTGLTHIDQVTQGTTATAEESASASQELAGLAVHLQNLVAGFRLASDVTTSHIIEKNVPVIIEEKQQSVMPDEHVPDALPTPPEVKKDEKGIIINMDDDNFEDF